MAATLTEVGHEVGDAGSPLTLIHNEMLEMMPNYT